MSWAAIDTMAASCGCDRRTVMRARAALERDGTLIVVANGGGSGKTTRRRIAIPEADAEDALPNTLDFDLVHHVLRSSGAKGPARGVHIAMALLTDGRTGKAEAGRDTLATITGLGRRTVIDAIKHLLDLGEVTVVQLGGGRGRRAVYGLRSNVVEVAPADGAQTRMVEAEEGQRRTVSDERGAEPHRFGKGAGGPLFQDGETQSETVQKRESETVRLRPPKNRRKGRDRRTPPNPPPSGGQEAANLVGDQPEVRGSARVAGRNQRALGTNPRSRRQLDSRPDLQDAWLRIVGEAESSSDMLAIQLAHAGPEVDGDHVVFTGPTASCLLELHAAPLVALAERHGLKLEQRLIDAARRRRDGSPRSASG